MLANPLRHMRRHESRQDLHHTGSHQGQIWEVSSRHTMNPAEGFSDRQRLILPPVTRFWNPQFAVQNSSKMIFSCTQCEVCGNLTNQY
jgi:hypothetical protein